MNQAEDGEINMKKYDITAVIKDGNEHRAYLIKEGLIANNPNVIVSRNKLEELIKVDKIMFLQWDGGKVVHKLTEEESRMLEKEKIPYKPGNLQWWWDNMLTYQLRHIDNVPNDVVVGSPSSTYKMPIVGDTCIFYLYGKRDRIQHIYNKIRLIAIEMKIEVSILNNVNGLMIYMLPIHYLHEILKNIGDSRIVVNADRFLRDDKLIEEASANKLIKYKSLSDEERRYWRNEFNKYNKNTVESALKVMGWIQ